MKAQDEFPYSAQGKRINNILRLQHALYKTYIHMLATSKTIHFQSQQSDASCAACKIPNSSFSHVNFKCPSLKPEISQKQVDMLYALAKEQIPDHKKRKEQDEARQICAVIFKVKMKYAMHVWMKKEQQSSRRRGRPRRIPPK